MSVVHAVEFDAGLLRQGTEVDLERYQREAAVPEHEVTLDITLNQHRKGPQSLWLRRQGDARQATPCYSDALLQRLGVDVQRLDTDVRQRLAAPQACLALHDLRLVATEQLDFSELRLDLQIAQEALQRLPQGYLPPESWDSGILAGFVDYRFNLYEQRQLQAGLTTRQSYLGLRSGLNAGQWYWRHEGDWQASDGARARYRPGATWVRRDVPIWSAQLTVGDGYSSGGVFEGSAFRGALLGSDERMLPESLRGFAPVVRGVANSTALLSVRQRGVLLHESTVAPGPFAIDDLLASGLSDDLEVTLREADGSVRTFTQPYHSAPLALRPGASRFEVNAGVWRDELNAAGPAFAQGSWQQGLGNHLSLHGGAWVAEDYLASAMGLALNSDFGALGLTGYQARSALPGQAPQQGQAMRLSWRTRLGSADLSTQVSLSDSPRYLTFDEFARAERGGRHQPSRWRVGLTLNQSLQGRGGRLSFAASSNRAWAAQRSSNSYNLGYFNHYGALSFGLALRHEQRSARAALNTFTFTLGMPLGERRRASISSQYHHDNQGRSNAMLRGSGTAGDRQQWGYGVSAVRQTGARSTHGFEANLLHRAFGGELSGSLAGREGYRQFSLGARGALVGHGGGITLAQPLGESFAIVHAPGAASAGVRQHPYIRLDGRGYGVVPTLQPYRLNTVELDPKGMSRDVELQLSGQSLVPRAGAASRLYFPTRGGRLLMFEARMDDGRPLPFGALVQDESGNEVGMVGQGSRLQARSDRDEGQLQVTWGDGQGCWVAYGAGKSVTCGAR
ncbi:fimbrial biogenesis outer membrane usher protein [Pseudomonas entomophila]|uniref:fimbria/pilus outer membrane usher protein n=1 Tax=Pseudomonas entomophila TaxID=312306 RepID=UPI0023D7EF99|nr:fimbria/pilus outer membrane usher protein [Pseudomonas entomophila]MDF0731655.1 fimbrial biogenesis outer membrane usher protein [Pseudomonas entomophila]